MFLRPATPGFLVTLIATILLALVSFNTPILKSIFFLKASLTVDQFSGTITLGTLGYCLELNNGTTCSKPSIGYEFDPNKLLGNNVSFAQIPEVVVKWITYALFLHVVALIGAAISAVFGLLAHVREMSMTCCSSCIAGFAAFIALVAFIFDIVFFVVVRSRVNGLENGQAAIGTAVWMTLAAWILLFFSGCFFAFGRCCLNRRPRGPESKGDNRWGLGGFGRSNQDTYAEQMRLDAVKAEADRKARQARGEIGLPALPEHEQTKPLNKPQYLEEDEDEQPYRDSYGRPQAGAAAYRGGYAGAPPGTRAVDEYYSPQRQPSSPGYPPQQPQRQYSTAQSPPPRSVHTSYASSTHSAGRNQTQYNAAGAHSQYPSGQEYGHTAGGTTYHSAASGHPRQQTSYSQYDPYSQQQSAPVPLNTDTYNSTGLLAALATPYGANPLLQTTSPPPIRANTGPYVPEPAAQPYYGAQAQQHERNYTLGGGAYNPYDSNTYNNASHGNDANAVRGYNTSPNNTQGGAYAYNTGATSTQYANIAPAHDPRRQDSADNFVYSQSSATNYAPAPLNTNVAAATSNAVGGFVSPTGPSGPRGPRQPQAKPLVEEPYEDSPPGYEPGPAQPAGAWAEKR